MDRLAPVALALPVPAADREPAPSPRCADARAVQEVVQGDDHTLALRQADGASFRIDPALRCPAIADEPGVAVVSPSGWACGRAKEAVVAGPRVCPIAHVARMWRASTRAPTQRMRWTPRARARRPRSATSR